MLESRLKVGVDVPWVTSWSAEAVLGFGPCATVDGRLAVLQRDQPGFGKPQYSLNHHRRQRASVRAMLCPQCGEAAPAGDRLTLTGKVTTAGALRRRQLGFAVPGHIEDDRVVINAGAIAPGHRACLTRAQALCPHLSADADLDLRPFPSTYYISPLQIAAQPHTGAPVLPVITFLQLCGITDRTDRRWRRASTADI